jgi:hypothetical protein
VPRSRHHRPSRPRPRPPAAQQDPADPPRDQLARSITGQSGQQRVTDKQVRQALDRGGRIERGPLFTEDELGLIEQLSTSEEAADREWLERVGIGTLGDARALLPKPGETGNWSNWLKQKPGRRLLVATLAWHRWKPPATGSREGEAPTHPAYTLGRTLAASDSAVARQERDEQIHKAVVDTLMPPEAGQENIPQAWARRTIWPATSLPDCS